MDGEDPAAEVERLARAARSGDRAALGRLLELDYDRLHAVCWKLLRDDEDALDAAQDAALAIARHIGAFDGRSRYTTWAHRIAVNAALDLLRRRSRHPVVPIGPAGTDREEEGAGDPPDAAAPTAELVTARVTVQAALGRLPDDQRTVLLMRHLLDLDYAEIADRLRVPVGTVRSRIFRARAALAALLGDPPEPGSEAGPPGRPAGRAPAAPPGNRAALAGVEPDETP